MPTKTRVQWSRPVAKNRYNRKGQRKDYRGNPNDGDTWGTPEWAVPTPYATGATAGIPGAFTPAGSIAPATVADLIAGVPNAVVAAPATAWTTGQYVQTRTPGSTGQAKWTGTAWAAGVALFDVNAHTIAEIQTYVNGLPMDAARTPEIQRLLAAEQAGQVRSTLIAWLQSQ